MTFLRKNIQWNKSLKWCGQRVVHKLISAFTQRMHKCVITKSREFYCHSQVSVWVTQPAAAVIFDHNVTALQLSCNGPLVTEQLWLCSNRGSDITTLRRQPASEGKTQAQQQPVEGNHSRRERKRRGKSLTLVCDCNIFVNVKLILQMPIQAQFLNFWLNFWLEFQYCLLLMLFLFLQEFKGFSFEGTNDCTTAGGLVWKLGS